MKGYETLTQPPQALLCDYFLVHEVNHGIHKFKNADDDDPAEDLYETFCGDQV